MARATRATRTTVRKSTQKPSPVTVTTDRARANFVYAASRAESPQARAYYNRKAAEGRPNS
jgi:hypothetical protein